MYSDFYNPDQGEIFQYRLEQIRQEISRLNLATKEEYQAAVVSKLNELMSTTGRMLPLKTIARETPGLLGDVQANLDILNNDIRAVSAQLLATEKIAAGLLNLYAATQSSLRKNLRRMLYTPTSANLTQQFVSGDLLDGYTCSVDLNAGIVGLPVASQTTPTPSRVRVGVSSDGAMTEGSSLGNLLDGQPHTVFEWEGKQLELVFEFPSVVLLNRISIEAHDYDGMVVGEISCSPDGMFHEDALDELTPEFRKIDAESNKFSGQYVADFTPKETKYLKLVLRDYAGAKRIRLRGISFFSRAYHPSGYVQFKPVEVQAGSYVLDTSELGTAPLTRIRHEISVDGVKYRAIATGEVVDLSGQLWHRVQLERVDAKFESDQNPFLSGVQDMDSSSAFTASQATTTTDLGGGVYRREIPLDTVSAALRIKDRVISGSLEVLVGGEKLAADEFVFKRSILYLQSLPATAVTLRYQTSLAGQSNFSLRKQYYSPYLFSAEFRRLS